MYDDTPGVRVSLLGRLFLFTWVERRGGEEGGGVQKNLKANRPNVHLLSLGPATSRLV